MIVDPYGYYRWQRREVELAGRPFSYAVKPGLPDVESSLVAAQLLVQAIAAQQPSGTAVDLTCGLGLVGAALMRNGVEVALFDDHCLALEATARTLAWNGLVGRASAGEPTEGRYDLAAFIAPKGREVGRRLLATAARVLKPGGRLYLAGANRSGVKSLIKDAEAIFGSAQVVGFKSSHRAAVCRRPETVNLPEVIDYTEREATVRGSSWRYVARPGIFSWDHLDEGSRALIETMQLSDDDIVLDLGCGSGIVGLVAASLARQVVSVDASASAVEATRRTYALNDCRNTEVYLSDCASAVSERRFTAVVTNPPFHQGVGTEYQVARQFIVDSASVLSPGGRLWLVANRFLPYGPELERWFGEVRIAYEDARYRVWMASK